MTGSAFDDHGTADNDAPGIIKNAEMLTQFCLPTSAPGGATETSQIGWLRLLHRWCWPCCLLRWPQAVVDDALSVLEHGKRGRPRSWLRLMARVGLRVRH